MQQYHGADLSAADGLLVAVARRLDPLAEGDVLELISEHPTVVEDLHAWCRRAGHRLRGVRTDGLQRTLHIERGFVRRTLADPPEIDIRMPRRGNGLDMRDWRVGRHADIPADAPEHGALAPRGAPLEAGAPGILFSLRRRQDVWADEVSELYEQAVASQWRGATDIPWHTLKPLDVDLEQATCQIMTFLAENEYAALYVPARFMGQIHPQFTEVVLFLATVMADEARHIEVFTKLALANGGGLGVAGAGTQASLASLLAPMDFSTASFLLSVLGEGTFLDLLAFLERYAPDEATRELLSRARRDEARHVHFGIAHARHHLAEDLAAAHRLEKAVEARADFLKAISGVGTLVEEALIIYSGGGLHPEALRAGTARVRDLYRTMHQGRVRRLSSVGFGPPDAERLSQLHTPNFM